MNSKSDQNNVIAITVKKEKGSKIHWESIHEGVSEHKIDSKIKLSISESL